MNKLLAFTLSTSLVPVVAALALYSAAPAAAQVSLPVTTLGTSEVSALPAQWLAPSSHPFTFASAVRTAAFGHDSVGHKVKRTSTASGGDAAVYQSLPAATPALLPTWPSGSALFDFKTVHDHAQAWATMTSAGVPWLWVRGYGDYQAEATASWNTTVTVPAGGSHEVVVRFVMPPANVNGVVETQGRAAWRARLRAELLVNGFPAWSTEAIRFRVDMSNADRVTLLQQFGEHLNFSTHDEDANDLNNSPDSPNDSSLKQVVHLSLGRFDPGAVIALSMIHRANVFSQPAAGGLHKCREESNEWFCSGSGVQINGSTGEGPRIYLKP